ncbi:hypothetical protein B566_EDAN009139 [Ephemera danica]|nr:hypothetical protein B566_EDAN009139 [Ephemera danica]
MEDRRRSSGGEMLRDAARRERDRGARDNEYVSEKAKEWREARWRPKSLENRFMIDLGPLHDVGFVVGAPGTQQELITCHKLMLARCSEVFSTKFFSGREVFTYDDEAPLRVPDMQPQAFDMMVDYIYGGQVYLDQFDVACDVLHGANKYRLTELAFKCRPFLWVHIYPANVWTALEFFAKEKEEQLYDAALQILQRKTSRLLERRNFEQISRNLLELLLQQESLTIDSELELLTACVRWAKAEAARRGLREEPSVLREMLGPALKYLRYLALSPDDLGEIADEELGDTIARVLVDNFSDDGEFTIIFRSPPNHESFYAFALVDDCFEKHIVEEYFENSYDVFSQAFSSSGDFQSTQLGVQVPTQIRPDDCDSETYEEDLTILLFDFTARKMLSVTRFSEAVKYNSVLDIPFSKKAKLDRKRVRKVVKVIFHKSGTYPAQFNPDNGEKNELISCYKFHDTEDAKLWHKHTYSYIRYCAYTVDTNIY